MQHISLDKKESGKYDNAMAMWHKPKGIDQIEAFGILDAKVFTEYPIRVVNGNSPGPDSLPPSLQPEKESWKDEN